MFRNLRKWWLRMVRRFRRSGRPRRPNGETLYVLDECIGRGGMSAVWTGHRKGETDVIAIKVLHPKSARLVKRYRKRFRAHEGNIAVSLDHPNVVHTFDYGRWGRRGYYIAQEYIQGMTLARILEHDFEGRVLPVRTELLLQIARGLAYIHYRGLIHRDFSPKNVIVNSRGIAKIIDFGLTIPADARQSVGRDRSGTASYMAPEQVRRLKVDTRTDVYAFGLTAFQVLTGKRAYPVSSSREGRMALHLNVEPRSLADAAPDLPPALGRVIDRCIEKSPYLRYKSMFEVVKAIEKALSGDDEEPEGGGGPQTS